MRSTRPRFLTGRPAAPAPAGRPEPGASVARRAADVGPVPVGAPVRRAELADAAAVTLQAAALAAADAVPAACDRAQRIRTVVLALVAMLVLQGPWMAAAIADLLPYGRLPHAVVVAGGVYWTVLCAALVVGVLTARRPGHG